MSSITLTASRIDTANWYQALTFTLRNTSTTAVNLQHAAIRFVASGHVDPWGNIYGDAIDGQKVTLTTLAQAAGELNEITLNQMNAFYLAAGANCSLTVSLAATSVPVSFELLGITLADDAGTPVQPEPEIEPEDNLPLPPETPDTEEDAVTPEEEPTPSPEVDNDIVPVSGSGVSVRCSNVDAQSWYQSVTFTVENGYNQAVDVNGSQITFTANAHVDPYGMFSGTLCGKGAPLLASDGGWPTERNTLTIDNNGPLWLEAGKSAVLTCALSTVQPPVSIENLQLTLVNDPARQGTIVLTFPPMAGNVTLQPVIVLTSPEGKSTTHTGRWGDTLTLDGLYVGNWLITLNTLEDEVMLIAPQQPTLIAVLDSSSDCQRYDLAWQTPVFYAEAELQLDDVAGMSGACVAVELWRDGSVRERTVELIFGQPLMLNKLTSGAHYDLKVLQTTINNVIITALSSAPRITPVAGKRLLTTVNYQKTNAKTTSFVTVNATVMGLPSGTPAQRYLMRSNNGTGMYQYSVELNSGSDLQVLPMPIMTGQYKITVGTVRVDSRLWISEFARSYSIVNKINNITLSFTQGVDLQVRGWPSYVAHGGVTVNSPDTVTAYAGVPVDALFKYDGYDGGGDPFPAAEMDRNGDGILDYDLLPVHRTATLSRELEAQSEQAVMPVMVVYTANASGGSAVADLQDPQRLRNHFGNFITQCLAAQSYKDETHPVPATFVLNPDFLGAMQQEPYGYTAVRQANSMPVNAQLAAAARDLQSVLMFSAPQLPTFSDDIYGYIQAINFIVHCFAPDVAFGWQTNVWATGTADWLLRDSADPQAQGAQIATFINELGVYSGKYAPDFIVFDKFERDCFSPDALAHYGWNATAWRHYLAMVKAVTQGLNAPAMIWQIPGGHMPTAEEGTSLIASNHFGAGGTFLMGDARIGSSVSNIASELTGQALNPATYGAATVGEWLAKDNGYDWGQQQVYSLPDYNIFSVLWGGGSTVSITTIHSNGEDGGWLAGKMREYYRAPCSLLG